jgi:hypothetical protein
MPISEYNNLLTEVCHLLLESIQETPSLVICKNLLENVCIIIYCTAVLTPYHCVAIPLLLHQHYWYDMLANTRHSWILKEESITTRMWATNFNAVVSAIHLAYPPQFTSHCSQEF